MDDRQKREFYRSDQMGTGEYGATRVFLNRDGSTLRLSFGRTGSDGEALYYGALLLSPEAVKSLTEQLAALDVP